MIKIGRTLLGKGPVITLTLTDSEDVSSIKKARHFGVQLLEIRIDRFRRIEKDYILQKLRRLKPIRLPLIATIRSHKEGGGRFLSDSKRIELFQKVLPFVSAVDLELNSHRLVKALVPKTHRMRKRVILSHHDFKSTPSEARMAGLLRKAKRSGADLVKIAVTPKKSGDVARLLLFAHRNRDKNLIAIAMGRLGMPSRLLAPLFGSLLTYTFLSQSQAPGQLSLKDLSRELKPFFKK